MRGGGVEPAEVVVDVETGVDDDTTVGGMDNKFSRVLRSVGITVVDIVVETEEVSESVNEADDKSLEDSTPPSTPEVEAGGMDAYWDGHRS